MASDGDSGRGRGRGGSRGRRGRGRGGQGTIRGGGSRGSRGGRGGGFPRGLGGPSGSAVPEGNGPRRAMVPANWPPDVVYLTTPVYTGISARQRQMLQTQPSDGGSGGGGRPTAAPLPEIPPILPFGPSPLVAIRTIADPAHPACGQRGLFAARNLPGGAFIVPYLGVYHRGSASSGPGSGGGGTNRHNKHESDYDLWLDRDADVAVDAVRQGNEARFVNDYRGTGRPRANAEFREVWDPRRGERGMAVFVRPAGKKKMLGGSTSPTGIAMGEEILVSYGKGFWEMRQKEAEAAEKAAKTEDTAGRGEAKEKAREETREAGSSEEEAQLATHHADIAATADQLSVLVLEEDDEERERKMIIKKERTRS